MHKNTLGQPIGAPVTNWSNRLLPTLTPIEGKYARLEILDAEEHAQDLFQANSADEEGRIWSYLPYGPYESFNKYKDWIKSVTAKSDPLFHAIIDQTSNKALGVASYMRINPVAGSIEVGHINYSPALQKTIIATEAMYLMMRRAFSELGYRRYEWKCNGLNAGSKAAAERLGFSYEGTFRQTAVIKGRNRDTAWFSMLDSEWPTIDQAFKAWLAPTNFKENGEQITSLSVLTSDALVRVRT